MRDKLAEILIMIAVEWVATPIWRENYHGDGDDGLGLRLVEPQTIEDHQRHLMNAHGVPEGDDGLKPWCDICGEPVDPGQICLVTDEPCQSSVEDLVAMHDDAHADNECYPEHEHTA